MSGLRAPGVLPAVADPLTGISHMLSHPFVRYAFVAGTAIALASGVVGYFLVLRAQLFTADALSHVAVTGALAALVVGASLVTGLYVSCVAVAVLLAAVGFRGRADDTVIGSVFAWTLGLGALFLAVFTTSSSAGNGTGGVDVLFGTIFGLSGRQSMTDGIVAVAVVMAMIALARPLLFATIDPGVARARKVPVRTLDVLFLVLVGITSAVAAQAVGALLLLGLLAAPAGAARRLTARPFAAMWISVGLAIASLWIGLTIAYLAPDVPPSFAILATSTAAYLISFLLRLSSPRRWAVQHSGGLISPLRKRVSGSRDR